jgi:hypothetical protein
MIGLLESNDGESTPFGETPANLRHRIDECKRKNRLIHRWVHTPEVFD